MRKTVKSAVLACAIAAALAVSGSAFATPRLIIGGTSAGSSQVAVQFTEDRSDPAPARVVVYAPAGYSGTFTAAPNTVLGTVHAEFQALAVSPDLIIAVDGQVVAADPATATGNTCAPGLHTAVWQLRGTVSGQAVNIPVYIDSPVPAGDPLAGTAPFRMILCASSPYVGTDVGGAAFGAKIVNVRMNLNQGTVQTPAARGAYVWRAVVTPYVVGGALPNVAGTVEARGIVTKPSILSISGRVVNKKKRQVRITGSLTSGTLGVRGATVRLTGSRRKTAKTNAAGRVTFSLRFKKKGRYTFKLSTTTAAFDVTPQGCAAPTAPTLPCVSATASGFTATSRTVRIKL